MTTPAFDIDNLPFEDDLNVGNSDDYQEPSQPAPIAKGVYGFKIKPETFSLRRKSADSEELRLDDGRYPIFTIGMIEVVDPTENARQVALYQDFRTKPFTRRGAGGETLASNLVDLIRSADLPTIAFSGIKEGLEVLKGLIQSGAVFYGKFDWVASDGAAAKLAVEAIRATAQATGTDEASPEVKKAINAAYAKYRVKGMSKFKNAQGVIVPYIVGEDGSQIEARVEVPFDGFVPQRAVLSGQVKLGPASR